MTQTTDPKYIADYVTAVHEHNRPGRWTIVIAITGSTNGYVVGIADEGISGYTPTKLRIPIPHYDEATKVLDEAVRILFPDRTDDENFEIEISSMR